MTDFQVYFETQGKKFPREPFTPTWDAATGNHLREYLAFFGGNGMLALSLKSSFGLARPTFAQFAKGFTIFRISFTRGVTSGFEYAGPTV